MSEEILEAFKKLKSQLDVRDYDDERFIKDLPENEPVSLVIPFERTGRGYLDIFRSYIGGDEHPELSDEELLEHYLQTPEGKTDQCWGSDLAYTSNTFKGTIELIESMNPKKKDQKNRFSEDEVLKLINALKKKGINALSKQDEKSQDPSTVVVMNNGIITPFMDKETITSIMPQIKKVMSDCNFSVGGHISPVTFEQLRSPLKTEGNPENTDFMHKFMSDFENQSSTEISEIKDLNELTTFDGKIKVSPDRHELLSFDKKNDESGRPYVWRGGVLGDKPFIANINTESQEAHALRKSWAMATPSIRYAADYATRNPELAGLDRSHGIGFLYQYATSETDEFFPDRGIERQPDPGHIGNREELPLLSYKHPVKNIFFYYAKGDEGCYLMRLDKDNPAHRQLLELYEPKEGRISENLLQKRINQFNEAAENGGKPIAYNPQISKGLLRILSQCSGTKEEEQEKAQKGKLSAAQQTRILSQQSQNG